MEPVAALYSRHAARFDREQTRNLMERPYLDAGRRTISPPARVLDLGCGGGEPIARFFADRGYEVTGVDVAEEMIAICRVRFPEMSWLCADMRSVDLSGVFDIVIAWDSFFHLQRDDQRAMFGTFRRYTADGGVLLFTSGLTHGEVMGDLFGDPLYHASLATSEYAERLRAQGYEILGHCAEDPNCGGHTVWLARLVPAASG
jgi:SAM-dependent methyltransferase